jgi:hypothetical protein
VGCVVLIFGTGWLRRCAEGGRRRARGRGE